MKYLILTIFLLVNAITANADAKCKKYKYVKGKMWITQLEQCTDGVKKEKPQTFEEYREIARSGTEFLQVKGKAHFKAMEIANEFEGVMLALLEDSKATESAAKLIFKIYSDLKKAGFTEKQAMDIIAGRLR